MVYQRRYFPALTITTISYAPKSITAEKIADGAVIHPKVAPDSIDSSRVIDESLKSVDIKDGEIKTPDLAAGAVTTEKIASAAVTPEKLSVDVLTRPISPGVNTAEILDDAVTKAKLAPNSVGYVEILPGSVGPTELQVDAVEESRVKNGAISRDKIAGGAIDSTKIAVDAVTGSEILNRCIGNTEIAIEGCHRENIKDLAINTAKLNAEACTAAKLAENAVTESRLDVAALGKRHLSSKRARLADVNEEFMGSILPDGWTAVMSAGGVISSAGILGVSLATGAVIGDKVVVSGDYAVNVLEGRPFFDALVRHEHILARDTFVGVEDGGGNRVGFEAGSVPGSSNWWARCDYSDGAVYVDTGIATAAFAQQYLSFEVVNATTVKFYVDGILKATIVSTVPAATPVFPVIEFINQGVGVNELLVRSLSLLADRS